MILNHREGNRFFSIFINDKPNSYYEKQIQKPGFLSLCIFNVIGSQTEILPQRKPVYSFRI